MDDVLILIAQTYTKDARGVMRPTEVQRPVFCKKTSATQREFFEGGRNGLNPEYAFTVFHGDYEDERVCEYNGQRYAIYRTYRRDSDYIELYVQREGGTNGTV